MNASSGHQYHSTPKQQTPSQRLGVNNSYSTRPARGGGPHQTGKSAPSSSHQPVNATAAGTTATPAAKTATAGVKRETHKDYLYGLEDAIIVEEVPIILSVAPNGVYCTTVAAAIQTPSLTNNSFFPTSSTTAANSQNDTGFTLTISKLILIKPNFISLSSLCVCVCVSMSSLNEHYIALVELVKGWQIFYFTPNTKNKNYLNTHIPREK